MTLMEPVTLRNGAQEPRGLVNVTMMAFVNLWVTDPFTAYELVLVARDPSHKIWSSPCEDKLVDLNLLNKNLPERMHGSVRNIILSATTVDGMDMTIQDPIAP